MLLARYLPSREKMVDFFSSSFSSENVDMTLGMYNQGSNFDRQSK